MRYRVIHSLPFGKLAARQAKIPAPGEPQIRLPGCKVAGNREKTATCYDANMRKPGSFAPCLSVILLPACFNVGIFTKIGQISMDRPRAP